MINNIYKEFYIEDIKVCALGDLEGPIGDEIRNLKNGSVISPKLILNTFLSCYKNIKRHDILTYIPSNRNNGIMEYYAQNISRMAKIELYKCISFKKIVKEQKLLESLYERENNIKGAFEIIGDTDKLKNKRILIIDDVYASGETLKEAIRTIKKVSLKDMECIVFAYRNHIFES